MSKDIFMHRVTCVVCGKTGRVPISKKTGKILTEDFWYWGKIHNPNRDKYHYVVADRDDPTITLDNPKKVVNPNYNPKASKYLGEYWEHSPKAQRQGKCIKSKVKQS